MMFDPIQRRQTGLAATGFGVVLISLAVVAGVGHSVKLSSVSEKVAAADLECENRMKQLGAKAVTRSGESLTARWDSLEGGYTQLGQSSAAAMACPGWTMRKFCMGQECSVPGATTLEMGKVTAAS